MNYKLENVSSCTKKLLFSFENLDLSTEIKAAVVKKQKDSNLKGFRKGKAPLAMVQKLFGPQIENDALNSFVQGQVFTAINAEKLRVVGYPSLSNLKYEAGKNVSFDATVEVFPEIKLKDYSKFSFKKDSAVVTDDDIFNVKKNYLSSRSEMTEVKDASAKISKGIFAVINFQGERADGSTPENMKGSEYLLEVGANTFIPGFEDGVIGLKKGDKKSLELIFPTEYHMAELRNEKVKFEVEILELKEKKLPDLTDDLAKEFGYLSADDFMTKNKEVLKTQKERQVLQDLHQKILEKLVEENKFDVPATMVVAQEKYLKEDLAKNLKQQGFNDAMLSEYYEKWAKDLTTKAEFQVRSGLILDTLATQFKVETSEKDLDEKFSEMAKTSGLSLDEVKKYYKGNDALKKNLIYAIREEKTFEKLREALKIA